MIDDQIRGAALAIILAVGVLLVLQPLYVGRTVEPFSELAVLGPNQKIGDYPKTSTPVKASTSTSTSETTKGIPNFMESTQNLEIGQASETRTSRFQSSL